MIEALVSGLILMIVSGVAFIAYNHPDFYERKINAVLFFVFSVFICLVIYNSTLEKSFSLIEKYIPKEKRSIAYNLLLESKISDKYVYGGYLVITLYLCFLGLLKIIRNKT
ncbi:hypothetical protein [Flavobacterium praedii]|uniref:hypothetical protein n=1 Tax=Flavobacterium praedii TaxID=3002900 RepID=UPI002481F884|nr:hypothetical protein [Flavobacterium praedii]